MKYLVKKEFVTVSGELYEVGETTDTDIEIYPSNFRALLENGFIEAVKEDKRWRAEPKGKFYSITQELDAEWYREGAAFPEYFEVGNYFKSQETAEKVAEALKLFFEWLHTKDEEDEDHKRYSHFQTSMNHARKTVLADSKASEPKE